MLTLTFKKQVTILISKWIQRKKVKNLSTEKTAFPNVYAPTHRVSKCMKHWQSGKEKRASAQLQVGSSASLCKQLIELLDRILAKAKENLHHHKTTESSWHLQKFHRKIAECTFFASIWNIHQHGSWVMRQTSIHLKDQNHIEGKHIPLSFTIMESN